MDKDSKNAINELISNQKPQNELWKGTELFLWNAIHIIIDFGVNHVKINSATNNINRLPQKTVFYANSHGCNNYNIHCCVVIYGVFLSVRFEGRWYII